METVIPGNDGSSAADPKATPVVTTTATADDKPPATRTQLNAKQSLKPGQMLVSQSKRFRLQMQGDGNLVLSDTIPDTHILWQTKTRGKWPFQLTLHPSGNMIIYETSTRRPQWESGTRGLGNETSMLVVQDNGELVILSDGKSIWSTETKQLMPGDGMKLLSAGESLGRNEALLSPDKRFRLVMQADCNLVLYDLTENNRPVWDSGTHKSKGARPKLQLATDGNLAIMVRDEYVGDYSLWSSKTAGRGDASSVLMVQDNGEVTIQSQGVQIWSSDSKQKHETTDHLAAGDYLYRDQYLQSPNGRYQLIMQGDCNLVLYDISDNRYAMWSSETTMNISCQPRLRLEPDGNLKVVDTDTMRWETKTSGRGDSTSILRVLDNGNVVLYSNDAPIWDLDTSRETARYWIRAGEALRRGDSLVSPQKLYTLVFQKDGNLAIYEMTEKRRLVWSAQPSGSDCPYAILQTDGNLVITSSRNQQMNYHWESGSQCPDAVLMVQDDGRAVIRSRALEEWSSTIQT